MQTPETPTSLKTPPHCFAIWYSNCYLLEVKQDRIQAGRTSQKRAPLSSSENHPENQKGAKVAYAGKVQRFYNKDSARCQESNCDVVLAEAAKCQARDEGL